MNSRRSQASNLFAANCFYLPSIRSTQSRAVSIVRDEPRSIGAFDQVCEFVQQNDHSGLPGVWREAPHIGNERFRGKHLGPIESAQTVDFRLLKQAIRNSIR